MQGKWNSHTLLVGMPNSVATLENSVALSYKVNKNTDYMIQQSHF